MKKISIALFILLGTLLVSACGTMAAQPVEALAVDTATAAIIAPSSTSTDTPMPTETLVPASPTASRMEFSVQSASLEIKVLDIDKPYRVHLGWDSYLGKEISFTPGAGQMFLALGVKVTNLTGADIPMKWTDLYLVNKYQEKWYPTWGAYQKTNSAMDPLMVEILKYDQVHPDFDPDAHFYASDNGFLRVIFRVPKDNLYYFFGIADLPLIEINWRYY